MRRGRQDTDTQRTGQGRTRGEDGIYILGGTLRRNHPADAWTLDVQPQTLRRPVTPAEAFRAAGLCSGGRADTPRFGKKEKLGNPGGKA